MNNKGMDRDIALQIASALNTTGGLIETINDHKYVAHIVTQPTDFTGDIGDDAVFSNKRRPLYRINGRIKNFSHTAYFSCAASS